MEMKNINRCLGGLRMEDQGERSPHTFVVNNFSIPRPRRKPRAIVVFSREFWMWQIADLKQLPGLKKKLGNVHISSKLNSAFSTIGKATADKITAKLVVKTHAFAFAWLTVHSNTCSCSESRPWNFEHFFPPSTATKTGRSVCFEESFECDR